MCSARRSCALWPLTGGREPRSIGARSVRSRRSRPSGEPEGSNIRQRINTAVVVAALAALAVAATSAVAAPRSCGSVKAKLPSGATQTYVVKVAKGAVSCPKADALIAQFYLTPGVASAGPNNTSVDKLKTGWRCVIGDAPPSPIRCTKGANTVRATPGR